MEHVSVSVVDGTTAQLRQLAGSPRKVGAYLTVVVSWLWLHRETLATRPLHEFVPVVPAESEVERMRREMERQRREIEQLNRSVNILAEKVSASVIQPPATVIIGPPGS